jgi:hypothetical protein
VNRLALSRSIRYPAGSRNRPSTEDTFAQGEAKGRAEGELEEARKILLTLSRKKLGQPGERVSALIPSIDDRDRLNLRLDRILGVATRDELLATADS